MSVGTTRWTVEFWMRNLLDLVWWAVSSGRPSKHTRDRVLVRWFVVVPHAPFLIRFYGGFGASNIASCGLNPWVVILMELHILLIGLFVISKRKFLGADASITIWCLPRVVNVLLSLFYFLARFFVILGILFMPNFEFGVILWLSSLSLSCCFRNILLLRFWLLIRLGFGKKPTLLQISVQEMISCEMIYNASLVISCLLQFQFIINLSCLHVKSCLNHLRICLSFLLIFLLLLVVCIDLLFFLSFPNPLHILNFSLMILSFNNLILPVCTDQSLIMRSMILKLRL